MVLGLVLLTGTTGGVEFPLDLELLESPLFLRVWSIDVTPFSEVKVTSSWPARRARFGALCRDGLEAKFCRLIPVIEAELGLRFLVSTPGETGRSLELPGLVPCRVGQHFEASQVGSAVFFGQESIQSSVEDIDPVGSADSTNSGWMVVEWIPSLWKNSLTFSATVMY